VNLNELITDARTSLDEAIRKGIDGRAFSRDSRHLSQFSFWHGVRDQPHLWDHQKAAIGAVVAYLNGDKSIPERPEHKEAALLKLPTGTGKSGIIAVIARCLPRVRNVLVLTPRTALTEQLLKDIRYRFWRHLGYEAQDHRLFTATAQQFGADLENVYTETFLPSRTERMLAHLPGANRAILVGTHQALGEIRRSALDPEEPASAICHRLIQQIKETFDLVIVDEGHYEPAVSWSRGVRDFNLPTVLLSATPYRNDYKSFRVRGRYLFNYPYADAVRDRIIRPADILIPNEAPARERAEAVAQFVQLMNRELPPRLEQTARWFADEDTTPKVMVRADDLDTMELLQAEIDRVFATQSVLIHDRAKKSEQNRSRFTSVSAATRTREDAQFWIHQYKLMEGIDDPSFVAVAIFDLMGNARQLVQQIGRATRYSKGDRRIRQTSWILGSPANADRIQTSWNRYRAYEEYAARNTAFIVTNEVTLPDRLLKHMAEYQYISGEFRGRFEFETPLAATDIQMPRSAAVLELAQPIADISALSETIEEAIMDKDRFKITPIQGMPANTVGFSYYAWQNSPYLIDRFFSEWKLGIFVAAKHGNLVFMHDTEGLALDMAGLGLKRADRSLMEKIFPEERGGTATRLSRLSFSSLEMSQHSIRSLAVRTRSFEEVFTDLLDPSLVPATAAGFVNRIGRYVGFARSRLRDAAERYVPISDYLQWTSQVAQELGDRNRRRSSVFDRYAAVVEGLSIDDAQPVSILLDPSQDTFIDMREDEAVAAAIMAQEDVDYDDLCADVDPETGVFVVRIGGEEVPCTIEYRERLEKYRIRSERLNQLFPIREADGRRQGQTLVQRLNQAQAFRVLVQRDGVVYSEGRFYQPRLRWISDNRAKPILDYIFTANSLADVNSEKGEEYYVDDRPSWYRRSIFGVFAATCEHQLAAHAVAPDVLTSSIEAYPIWLCDDDNEEVSDFIGLDMDNKRLVFVHAKKGTQGPRGHGYNVGGLQVVGRQALASLAFISRGEPSQEWTEQRWTEDVRANVITLNGRNRIFSNPDGLTAAQLNDTLRQACSNPSFDKDLWIVGAMMARRDAMSAGLDANQPENYLRQFLMHWDALQTACARASVRLKFYCS
jgi:superfamily II DNA or RNA helicase